MWCCTLLSCPIYIGTERLVNFSCVHVGTRLACGRSWVGAGRSAACNFFSPPSLPSFLGEILSLCNTNFLVHVSPQWIKTDQLANGGLWFSRVSVTVWDDSYSLASISHYFIKCNQYNHAYKLMCLVEQPIKYCVYFIHHTKANWNLQTSQHLILMRACLIVTIACTSLLFIILLLTASTLTSFSF